MQFRDFDWSLINENSDTYVVDQLAPSLVPEMRVLLKTRFKNQWTALMVWFLTTKQFCNMHYTADVSRGIF